MPEGDRIGVLIMEEIRRKEAISTPEYIKLLAERDALKAALSEIATFDKWSHAPGQCPMGCNAPEVAKKVLGVEISTGWEKLPD